MSVPTCEHWILGDITVQEHSGPHRYERAVLVTFRTVGDYREALKFFDPVFSEPEPPQQSRHIDCGPFEPGENVPLRPFDESVDSDEEAV